MHKFIALVAVFAFVAVFGTALSAETHKLAATPETTWTGYFDNSIPPVLKINSGDTVEIECVSGGPEIMPAPESGLVVPKALTAIHGAKPQRLGPHIITGPVAIAGAEPGDALEIHVDRIEFGAEWGFCNVRPLAGTIPADFPAADVTHIPIDAERRYCTLPWGAKIPLAPFFGVMGVAPPSSYGTLSTKEPREFGGNLDNKELGSAARCIFPLWCLARISSSATATACRETAKSASTHWKYASTVHSPSCCIRGVKDSSVCDTPARKRLPISLALG